MFSGQSIVAISQIFILGIPPQLAATWFPSDQVSSACAIGVFGNQVWSIKYKNGLDRQIVHQDLFWQLGVALGFVIPSTIVSNQDEENIHLIGEDLFKMFLGVAIITTILLVVIIFGKSFIS